MSDALAQIGRYTIQGELGRGAMGVVYKAFDPLVERTLAIKTIPVNVEGPDLLVHRLQLEAKSVGQLEHPNIVTLYDAGEANGVFYIAMQFVQGETLRDRITRQRWFALKEIQEFLRQIGSALDYAHQHGVIHRDIKPSNIMITSEGNVKLADFGIAKLAGGATTTGLIMGTPSYMSPEQALGKPLDGRSDIFSLGSILYELITGGEQAFPGTNASTVLYRIVHESPSPITALQPGFDPALEAIVLKSLAKQPEQRYSTCAELAAALDRYAPSAPASEQATASNVERTSQSDLAATASVTATAPRQLRLMWSAAGVFLALIVVAGLWWIVQSRRPAARVLPSAASSPAAITNPSATRDAPAASAQPVAPAPTATIQNENSAGISNTNSTPAPKLAAKAPDTPGAPTKAAASHKGKTGAPAAATPADQTQPETFQGYMLKGDLAFQQSRYQDALAAYSKAHQMDSNNREARRKMAVVLTLLGRVQEAQQYK